MHTTAHTYNTNVAQEKLTAASNHKTNEYTGLDPTLARIAQWEEEPPERSLDYVQRTVQAS